MIQLFLAIFWSIFDLRITELELGRKRVIPSYKGRARSSRPWNKEGGGGPGPPGSSSGSTSTHYLLWVTLHFCHFLFRAKTKISAFNVLQGNNNVAWNPINICRLLCNSMLCQGCHHNYKNYLTVLFDYTRQMEAKLPLNVASNQKNAAFSRG